MFADALLGLVELLLPPHCVGCTRILPPGRAFCEQCDLTVERLDPKGACRICADPVADGVCERCQAEPPAFERVCVGGQFSGAIQDAVHRLKFGDAPWTAAPLASWAFSERPETWAALDVLVPIPLHVTRHRSRGYNQAALVASNLSARMGIPMATRSLVRARATRPVAELAPHERVETVRGAFAAGDVPLAGKHVGLVDDVVTTSSTVREASRVLRAHGAASVVVIAIARGGWLQGQ